MSETTAIKPKAETGAVLNIAAYKFANLDDLPGKRVQLKRVCAELGLRGTILLSPEGINVFLAGLPASIESFLESVRAYPELENLEVKRSWSDNQPFNRMLVKLKREIIAFGVSSVVPQRETSPKISAEQLRQWLDEGRPVRLLDVRNDYEVDLGTFDGAERLGIQHFRQFPEIVERLPEESKTQPLVMFCTGGIRCEKAGPLMEQLGFQQVYQLDGGILKYFEDCGGAHYHGDCFVFDGRVALNPALEPTGAITCFQCQHVLDHEDIQSEKFRFGVSCPYCFKTREEQLVDRQRERQAKLVALARSQPGTIPYANRRLMYVAAKYAGQTLIDFLCEFHPPTDRSLWLEWIQEGTITSHSQRVVADQIVREGQQLEHVMPNYVEPPIATEIQILFEDEGVVVVDKPAPLPVHPSGRYNRNTLLSLLSEVYRPEKLRAAHRIDGNTSGIVVFSRKYAAAREIQPQFTRQEVSKHYLLRVHGVPDSVQFECCEPIGDTPLETGARTVDPHGLSAITRFQLLTEFEDGTSLLLARPITGRTNQIRIHASYLGHSIVGDPLYLPGRRFGRQQTLACDDHPMCLHAWKLSFLHPFTKHRIDFEAGWPGWAGDKLTAELELTR